MREIVVNNWDELSNAIFTDVWDKEILRYRNNVVYRGVGNRNWSLVPSLNRCCEEHLDLERQILRSFRKYGYAELRDATGLWQTLAMGQQFGLPTRLLDWTYSPLVAAHFATADIEEFDVDGSIICCDMAETNRNLPEIFGKYLFREKCNVFSMEMLDNIADSFEKLSEISEKPFAFFFEPASTVNRIANQYALFSVVSNPKHIIDELPQLKGAFLKIIIPSSVKLEIRDKLDYINISERMIYPGLEGVCKWIARRYSPLGPRFYKGT
ncbi:MAG: FRG domain-containing protein [Eubacteriales bacterium]|nr:FRG domain-containing protein [Eubacteriales bacterium]